jgi:HSP20 family molecular chaperone IbpA
MAERDISIRKETAPAGREEMRAAENYLRPTVDIFETEENITLVADMPGVEKEDLDINLERGILTVQGIVIPVDRGKKLFREFSLAGYYRQFQLPDVVDSEKTSAEFKNGVLTLTMPKSEAAKPRRIEIRP